MSTHILSAGTRLLERSGNEIGLGITTTAGPRVADPELRQNCWGCPSDSAQTKTTTEPFHYLSYKVYINSEHVLWEACCLPTSMS